MSQSLTCSKCGAPLPADAPGGACPRCVLELGWAKGSEASAAQPGHEPGPTTAREMAFAPPEPSELARHFPQLDILELLGRGGMGAVYKARQRALDRLVAVKVLPPEVGRDPAFAERFTREARALAKLSHPNIVAIHDVGESGGYYYFVMEYVDGTNLRHLLGEQSLAPAQSLAIVPQVCEALQYAHDEGIVHRDIKPENILVDKKGRVKIADFGLAKLLGAAQGLPQLTGTYQVMGTYHYMAPEQFERPQEVDHRADIYSLGVVLYELLTRELPIGRFALPSHKAQIDVRLDEVVLRALEKDPPRRYQHASEVKTDVDAIVRSAADVGNALRGVPPVAAPAVAVEVVPPPRALSVPIKINNLWGGLAEGHGILRFDGEELLLEFVVRENVFQSLNFGSYRAPLPLYDLSQVTFKPGWWGHTLSVQVSRFAAISHLPGCDRGKIKLHVTREDRAVGEKLAVAVGARLSGESWTASLAAAESHHAPAAAEEAAADEEKSGQSPVASLIVGAVMMLAGLVLVSIGTWKFIGDDARGFHTTFWAGVGLLIGGGGSIGAGRTTRRRANESAREMKPEAAQRETARSQLTWPGMGLLVAAVIDLLALVGLVGGVAYAVWTFGPPPNMLTAYALAFLGARLALAPLQLVWAGRMLRLEGRRGAGFAARLAIVPGSPAWLLGLPMGIWALLLLRRDSVAEAFAESPPRATPLRLATSLAPLLAALAAGLVFVSWTYYTLPMEPSASRAESWIDETSGKPRISPAFATRLELREPQVQAINDVLAVSHEKYLESYRSNIKIDKAAQLANSPGVGAALDIQATVRPFPTRLASLESQGWKQIDLVLDERQQGLAHQCDLFSDLFFAGRDQVRVELQSRLPEASKGGSRIHFSWQISRRSWFSGLRTGGGGENLPKNLGPIWERANTGSRH